MPQAEELHADPQQRRHARAVLLMAGAALALAGLYFVRFGRLNHDEGNYLYAARLLVEGQLPYRDFVLPQAPLLPLVHAIPQWLAPGIETGRWIAFAISSLTCALTLRLAFERGGATAVAVVVGGIIGAPLATWALVSTRTEPITALCLVVAASCLARPEPSQRQRAVAVLAAVLAAATRISSAPAALFVGLWALRGVRSRPLAARILIPGLVAAVPIAALVFSGGFERAWFQLVEMQSQRYQQFQPTPLSFSLWLTAKWGFLLRLVQQFGVLSLVSSVITAGFALLWLLRRAPFGGAERLDAAGPLAVLVLLAWAPNLVPLLPYPVYLVAVLPLVLTLGGWGLAAAQERWLGSSFPARRALLAGALVGLALAQGQTLLVRHDRWAARGPTDLEALREVARELEDTLPAEQQLFSMDVYLAVESKRRIAPGLEMGIFSWFPRRPAADAERLGLLTTERLLAAIADPGVGAVAVSDEALGILARGGFSGYQPRSRLSERQIWQAYPPLRAYRLTRVVASFGPRDAPLYLMLPKRPR